ncbi:hypothetical protein ACW5R3_00295 [Bizionia sp. KMM 8389]
MKNLIRLFLVIILSLLAKEILVSDFSITSKKHISATALLHAE